MNKQSFSSAFICALLLLVSFTSLASNPEVRITGTLNKQDFITIPGTSSPALFSLLSDDQTTYGLDFSEQPGLESIAESNRFNKVTVEGELYLAVTETPSGQQLEWPMIRVKGISVPTD